MWFSSLLCEAARALCSWIWTLTWVSLRTPRLEDWWVWQEFFLPQALPFHDPTTSSFQRFNVAVTRAKALLIVVGNPLLLGHDPDWKA